ncbi:MAG: WG repeat-containing protein [Rikenellaceae bacterium]
MQNINISCFVDAVLNPKLHFSSLYDIEVEMDSHGVPIFYSGVNSVVFKVKKNYSWFALKCYFNCDKQHIDGLRAVNNYFKNCEYSFLNHSQILENELTIYDLSNIKTELPVELSSWVDGTTLSEYVYMLKRGEIVEYEIDDVVEALLQFSLKLLSAPFAHGDIKAENILLQTAPKSDNIVNLSSPKTIIDETVINKVVNKVIDMGVNNSFTVENCEVINKMNVNRDKCVDVVLIDFNNAYIENLNCSPISEIGTYLYRHPLRDENYYNGRIDDYPLLIIIATLLVLKRDLSLYMVYSGDDFPIFVPDDIISQKSELFNQVVNLYSDDILFSTFISLLQSESPAVENLYRWIEVILERFYSTDLIGSEPFLSENYLKYGIKDSSCLEVVIPAIFNDIHKDSFDRFCVEFKGAWGVISKKGKTLVDFNYQLISPSRCGRSLMKRGGMYGYFDENYREVIAPKFEEANSFAFGYGVVKINGKFGYINLNGEVIVEPIYDYAYNIREERVAKVRLGSEILTIDL